MCDVSHIFIFYYAYNNYISLSVVMYKVLS